MRAGNCPAVETEVHTTHAIAITLAILTSNAALCARGGNDGRGVVFAGSGVGVADLRLAGGGLSA